MVHMERVAELAGRGFGKTRRASQAHGDDGLKVPDNATDQTRAVFDTAKAKTWGERRRLKRIARVACPHAVVRHKQVPHPRYGDRVPYFVSWTEPLVGPHRCTSGWGAMNRQGGRA